MKITQGHRVTWGGDEDLGLHEEEMKITVTSGYMRRR